MAATTTPRLDRPDGYVPTLDGWRAIAVLGVVMFHFTVAEPSITGTWVWQVLRFGRYGVDVFFAISGLLITSRLLDEVAASGSTSLRGFYVRRAFRILPAAFVFFAFAAIEMALHPFRYTRPLEWIGSALFFRNYVLGSRLTHHLWSLSVEEHFYALWPVVFVLLTRRKAYGWVLVGPVVVIVWRALLQSTAFQDFIGGDPDNRTDCRLDALLWGAAAAIALRDPRLRAAASSGLGRSAWLLAIGTFVAGEFMGFAMGTTLQAIAAPCIVLGTVLRPSSLRARILETPPLRWIGRLSYGMYLFQQPLAPWMFDSRGGWLYLLPITCVSYYAVERPLMKLGRDIAARRRTSGFASRMALAVGVSVVGLGAIVFAIEHARLRGAHVLACTDANFGGYCVTLDAGTFDLRSATTPFPDHALSSFRVGEGARARLCSVPTNASAASDCVDVPSNAWLEWLGDRNDTTSIIEVAPDP